MALSGQPFGDLAARNPWWSGSAGLDADPHLRRLRQAPFQRTPPVLASIRPDQPNVYTLRGPRQVGKTTLLKQLAARLIDDDGWDPRRVVYYPLDLIDHPRQIVDLVQRIKAAYPAERERRWCILLDEISSVPDWQRGIKYLRDNTDAADDCFVLTGSSARDIRRGGERLPGRRGPDTDLDKLLLPLSFSEFVRATRPELALAEPNSPAHLLTDEGKTLVQEAMLSFDELERALELYALTGGFPSAVADHLRQGSVSSRVVSDLWDIVAGDVDRWGRHRVEAVRVLSRVVRGLGSMTTWQALAVDMGVAAQTAEGYADLLADAFLLLIVYFRELDGKVAPRKGKKLYTVDPLVLQIPAAIEGGPLPALPNVVENLVAMALFRACETDLMESFRLPQALCFWRSARDREVDFLAGPRPHQLAVEVKYQSRVTVQDTLTIRNALGHGVVLSRRDLVLDGPVPIIPAAVFLALLSG